MSNLPNNNELHQLMIRCKLEHLVLNLEESKDWGAILSVGEQQRIGFCRVLINAPNIVYLDEATSAIDEDTEAELYAMIKQELPDTLLVSVGHRSTIAQWHDQEFDFNNKVG
jgi:vitamin B12/bleomycin/antimicrobial peptide transport system ATP-binding/permease protein